MTESTRPLECLSLAPEPPALERLSRLSALVQSLIADLGRHQTIAVHHRISQAYYMEKNAEMMLLSEQLTEAHRHLCRVAVRAEHHYRDIYCRWQNDARWLGNHLRQKQDENR